MMVAHDGERMIVNFPGSGIPDQIDWLPLQQVATAAAAMADIRWVEAAHALFSVARTHWIPTILDGEIADADAYRSLLPAIDHAIFFRAWPAQLRRPTRARQRCKLRRSA
ncbi:hypothetical protein ACFS07_08685 [Undibacterium arcticum]